MAEYHFGAIHMLLRWPAWRRAVGPAGVRSHSRQFVKTSARRIAVDASERQRRTKTIAILIAWVASANYESLTKGDWRRATTPTGPSFRTLAARRLCPASDGNGIKVRRNEHATASPPLVSAPLAGVEQRLRPRSRHALHLSATARLVRVEAVFAVLAIARRVLSPPFAVAWCRSHRPQPGRRAKPASTVPAQQ